MRRGADRFVAAKRVLQLIANRVQAKIRVADNRRENRSHPAQGFGHGEGQEEAEKVAGSVQQQGVGVRPSAVSHRAQAKSKRGLSPITLRYRMIDAVYERARTHNPSPSNLRYSGLAEREL